MKHAYIDVLQLRANKLVSSFKNYFKSYFVCTF